MVHLIHGVSDGSRELYAFNLYSYLLNCKRRKYIEKKGKETCMYKKLEEEDISFLLETGIAEFAAKGLDRANINVIAEKAGMSVGVIYKYYGDKDKFFLSCVEYSLKLLEKAFQDVISNESDI